MFPFAWLKTIETLAPIVYVLLAGLVTVDVLLKKSDVRAALGWIAAAWLSPIFGSLLYYMFGINRVTRRALRLRRLDDSQAKRPPHGTQPDASPNLATLAEVGRRVTESPLIAGNKIEILQGGDEAYPAMLKAIDEAKTCIAMASYIYEDDAAGRKFSEALIAACNRGVQVRVLLDSVGAGYFFPFAYERLKAAGVPVARFLHTWMPWRMPFLNMRNHRKILVIDGVTSFVGGMNISKGHARSLADGN
jgi:cardiolipin synthase